MRFKLIATAESHTKNDIHEARRLKTDFSNVPTYRFRLFERRARTFVLIQ